MSTQTRILRILSRNQSQFTRFWGKFLTKFFVCVKTLIICNSGHRYPLAIIEMCWSKTPKKGKINQIEKLLQLFQNSFNFFRVSSKIYSFLKDNIVCLRKICKK